MRKFLFCTALALTLMAGKVGASVNPPSDERGNSLYTADFVGVNVASIDSSTGTSLIMINSTGTGGSSTGRAIVYGVIASSIAQTDYIVLKDTTGVGNGLNGVGSQLTLQGVASTVTVITNSFQMANSTANYANPYPQTNIIMFPRPILFKYGILAVDATAPTSNNGVSRWTILWRPTQSAE